MTLDEAILHAKEVAERNRKQYKNCPSDRTDIRHQTCEECAEEHEQLAEWLEDYKHIKQWKSDILDSFCKYDCSTLEEIYKSGYEKAIFDIKAKMKEINHATKPIEGVIENGWGTRFVDLAYINKIAEQLKKSMREGGD